jgi:hypothetical protein
MVQVLAGVRDFFSKAPGLVLRLTQPPSQWVHVAPCPRVKQTGSDAIHSIPYWQTHNHHWHTVSKDIYKLVMTWQAVFHWIAPEILRRILHHKYCLLVQSQIWTCIIHLLVAMHHLHPLSLFVHTNQLHVTQVPSETGIGKEREREGEVLCNDTRGKKMRIICPISYFVHHTTHMDWPWSVWIAC